MRSLRFLDGDTGFVLGGTRGRGWVDAETTALALHGDTYRLYPPDGPPLPSTGSTAALVGPPCLDTIFVGLEPKPSIVDTIAVGGDWNARPRAATSLSTDTGVYRDAVAEILRAHGIKQPDVRLTRVLRIDLEGDGVDEVLISATRMAGDRPLPQIAANDYSLVVLRKVVAGQVHTILLAGEFYPASAEFGAPNVYTIANLLDLNGDGRLEIVVDSAYYEGAATTVVDVAGDQAHAVLDTGCGA